MLFPNTLGGKSLSYTSLQLIRCAVGRSDCYWLDRVMVSTPVWTGWQTLLLFFADFLVLSNRIQQTSSYVFVDECHLY